MEGVHQAGEIPKRYLIIVLDNASLETVSLGSSKNSRCTLLNCDDHQGLIRKHKVDIANIRPDITHQCLLMALDSPLNKAGLLRVYVRTSKNVLIEIDPHTRIPRTFKRFSGLMSNIDLLIARSDYMIHVLTLYLPKAQLLRKLSIRSLESSKRLLKVIKNPISIHLPDGSPKIGTFLVHS